MATFGAADPVTGFRDEPRQLLGVFGGTFDPIHSGHLRMAEEVLAATCMDELRLVPCRIPPHRPKPMESAENRAALIEAALAGKDPRLRLDRRELERDGPSYMVDTLTSLRDEIGDTPAVALILGADAFEQLASWSRWTVLPSLCHLLVLKRPGFKDPRTPEGLSTAPLTRLLSPKDLRTTSSGGLFWIPLSQIDISSTEIRRQLGSGCSAEALLPEPVSDLIRQKQLYRPDPSEL